MCGIVGKLTFESGTPVSSGLIGMMVRSIRHRGPDDAGAYTSQHIGLGHCRLSIIDLSSGSQPLSNEDGTVWIVFNGEIYNYQELRTYLLSKGHQFRTQSDTEVIVHLYEELGETCLDKLRGMFAFAIWDESKKLLFLARDRIGIKPLYYWLSKRSFVFASEIKSILADPEVIPEVMPEMVDRFLTFDYLPGEETLFLNVRKLPPASYMIVKDRVAEIRHYWDLRFEPANISLRDAEEQLLAVLKDSVRLHMISDVPVGFLLSGGVDSTAMLGMAVGLSDHPLRSFTVGFSASGIPDERPYAALAARTYNSEHRDLTITARDFQEFLPKYIWHMEEPVCEPPAVALYYVSRLAQEYVKVLISGEGGDEAFGGYSRYRTILLMERLKRTLAPIRVLLAAGADFASGFLRSEWLSNYGPLLNVPFEHYYYSRTSTPLRFFNSHGAELYSHEFSSFVDKKVSLASLNGHLEHGPGDLLSKMLYVDTKTSLVDDLLLKADKMTMANSLELRVPLLDHKVLEFAASMPTNYKVRGTATKYIVKRVLGRMVPREILRRRKAGFPVPYASWLRKDLRNWVLDILLDSRTLCRGYFEKATICRLLSENLRTGQYAKELFSLLTLELWHREFLCSPRVAPEAPGIPRSEAVSPEITSLPA